MKERKVREKAQFKSYWTIAYTFKQHNDESGIEGILQNGDTTAHAGYKDIDKHIEQVVKRITRTERTNPAEAQTG